jgi:hypothetical protein
MVLFTGGVHFMDNVLSNANLIIKKNRPACSPNHTYTLFERDGFVQINFQSCGCMFDATGSCYNTPISPDCQQCAKTLKI